MTRLNYNIFLIPLLFCLNSIGQKINNVRVSQDSTSIVIMYDLSGKLTPYNVNFFYTLDNGKTWQGPLKKITGDINAQTPGKNKKAFWNAIAEKREIEGMIQFKLICEPVVLNNQIEEKTITKPIKKAIVTTDFSADYNKYKIRKTIWLVSAIGTTALGTFSALSANSYYKQYQTATTNATSLHQKVVLYDIVTPIVFGLSGFCAVELIINAKKQGKAKKQMVGFYPQLLNQGAGIDLVYNF